MNGKRFSPTRLALYSRIRHCASLTHMHPTIKTKHGDDHSRQSDHDRRAGRAPSTGVGKVKEDITGASSWCKNPQRCDNGEQTDDMNYQYQAFDHG